MKPSHNEIAARASQLWEKEGRQLGKDLDYWLQAEAELMTAGKGSAQSAAAQQPPAIPSPKSPKLLIAAAAPSAKTSMAKTNPIIQIKSAPAEGRKSRPRAAC
jgi:hypothetical protein